MNKKGQSVFYAGFTGAAALIFFIIAFPVLNGFAAAGAASTTNAFASFMIRLTPFFLFIMICWAIIFFMKGGAQPG